MIRFIIYLLQIYALLVARLCRNGVDSRRLRRSKPSPLGKASLRAWSRVGASVGIDADMCVILSGAVYAAQSNPAGVPARAGSWI